MDSAALVIEEAKRAVDMFDKMYGHALRDDRKESLLACFHARRMLEAMPLEASAEAQEKSILQGFYALASREPELAAAIGTIAGRFRNTYPKSKMRR
jgi:hypothetical protein